MKRRPLAETMTAITHEKERNKTDGLTSLGASTGDGGGGGGKLM